MPAPAPVIARTRWRDLRLLRAIHLALAAEHPGVAPKLDDAKLARALEGPRALIQSGDADGFRVAAAYAVAIAKARALSRGNGAFALAAFGTVLHRNGIALTAPEPEAAAAFRELENSAVGAAEIEAWARANAAHP